MREYEIKAGGKINLGLDVVGRREDGYHLVRMVMQTVRLCDRLEFRSTAGPAITIESNLQYLPVNENNLIYKAIELIRKEYNITDGMRVRVDKRIPVAAGMAGGSADAAATLKAMNRMYDLDISRKRLSELGLTLGADVPYCLMGGTALAEGIGEELTPLPAVPAARVLLVRPAVSISTAGVYAKIDAEPHPIHPDIDGLISAIEAGDIEGMCSRFGNSLEAVSCTDYPVIEEIKSRMLELGACGAMMSGSGPTVFGIFTEQKKAEHAFYEFKGGEYGRNTFLTDFFNPHKEGRKWTK